MTKTLHKGKKANAKDLEDELVKWILMNRSIGIPVTSWEVTIKPCSLEESLKIKIQYTTKLVLNFLKRDMLNFSLGTHFG